MVFIDHQFFLFGDLNYEEVCRECYEEARAKKSKKMEPVKRKSATKKKNKKIIRR